METYHPLKQPSDGARIGIALSGGGLRSAAFNLGVLQTLDERKILPNAAYLAAVSGGNYIASAYLITAAMSDQATLSGGVWRPGSVEERWLRSRSTYLATGTHGRIWLATNYLYGLLLNITPLFVSSFLIGTLLGLLYRLGVAPQLGTTDGPLASTSRTAFPVTLGIMTIAAFTVVFLARWRERGTASAGDDPADAATTNIDLESRNRVVTVLVAGAAALVLVTWVMPALVRLFRRLTEITRSSWDSAGPELDQWEAWLITGFVSVVVLVGLAALSVWMLRRRLVPWLASSLATLSGPALLLVPCIMAADRSSALDYRLSSEIPILLGAVALLVFFALFVHNRRYSMHLFYRERLSAAFAVRRVTGDGGEAVAEPIPVSEPLYFTELHRRMEGRRTLVKLPNLIVCSAVNISGREIPPGRNADSYTFESDLSGGPVVTRQPTAVIESQRGSGGTQLTLRSMMAISGAAISPLMGRFTSPPLRFLMAILNLRLGVWLPNPKRYRDDGHWDGQAEKRSITRRIKNGWYEPGGLYVLREALGLASPKLRFIYVTDGGHWENLGVTELVRRGCTHILSFDAGAGASSTTAHLGQAMALSRSELGTKLKFDREELEQLDNIESGYCSRSSVIGRIHYPDPAVEPGWISYARAVLVPDSAWDLQTYHKLEPVFPAHPTSDQLFDDMQFESYRALGQETAERVLDSFPLSTFLSSPGPDNLAGPR